MEHDGRQIYPPSITGKGARFAPGGSVYDHAFGKSDAYTLGVTDPLLPYAVQVVLSNPYTYRATAIAKAAPLAFQ